MAKTIICTCGVSLITNNQAGKQVDDDLTKAISDGNEIAAGIAIGKLGVDNRRAGAELNSINSLLNSGRADNVGKVILIVSDTADGKLAGSVLKTALKKVFNLEVSVEVIQGMDGNDFKRFRNTGLKTMAGTMISLVRKEQNAGPDVLINATGGYKAQIALAGLIGQVLQVPVFYQFELFAKIIEIPALPISLDQDLWLDNVSLLNRLTEVPKITELEGFEIDHRIESLIEREDGYACLSAVGQVFHEICRLKQEEAGPEMPPPSALSPADKKLNVGDGHHMAKGIDKVFHALLELPYVISIRTDRLDRGTTLYFRRSKSEINQLEGHYFGGEYACLFFVRLTSENQRQTDTALLDVINRKIGT
jgi:putative CRISPR-associated protein (TIGR02619 family)